jgi:phage repressor protein C with HTH and peptisase S24 domain
MEKETETETIATRYATIRSRAGLSKKAFAESLGIHPVVSGDIELGKRDPSRDVLVRLVRTYAVDINWLLTGIVSPKYSVGEISDVSLNEGMDISNTNDDSVSSIVHIEFVRQQAAAGRGIEIEEYVQTQKLPVLRSFIAPRRPERVKAVEVRGDSMTGIGLDDRDVVLFAPDEKKGDGVHVISIASQLLVKRILFDPAGHTVHVMSENPSYPVRILSGADLEDFKVEGRVIGWMHRY